MMLHAQAPTTYFGKYKEPHFLLVSSVLAEPIARPDCRPSSAAAVGVRQEEDKEEDDVGGLGEVVMAFLAASLLLGEVRLRAIDAIYRQNCEGDGYL